MSISDALAARVADLQTVGARAAEVAAIKIATKLRGDVKRNKRAANARVKKARAEAAVTHGKAAARRMVRKPKHRGSGISIDVNASPDAVTITASNQVQYLAREKDEHAGWMSIVGEAVRKEGAR